MEDELERVEKESELKSDYFRIEISANPLSIAVITC